MNAILNPFKKLFSTKNKGQETSADALYIESDTKNFIPLLSELPDEELVRLNELLPWSAFVVDEKGRKFGEAHSNIKRNAPQIIPDYRSELLEQRVGLKGKTVLEAGCFEGIHTIGLAQKGAVVTAFDSRIENVIKTMVRCGAFNINANVCYWNVEHLKPEYIEQYDIIHHVGVLYHLLNPIEHLEEICACAKQTLLLDTHVSSRQETLTAEYKGFKYRYCDYKEFGRESPFAGMKDFAKWLHPDDLLTYLGRLGFRDVDLVEERDERNGDRVLIIANR